jgi:GNAT superfamily N-acetyltransferase
LSDEAGVSLVEMTGGELIEWLPGAVERFIAERVSAGASLELATSGGEAQRERSFPGGRPLPGHHALQVRAGATKVGALWLGSDRLDRHVILLDLDGVHRDDGTARATIQAAEQWAVGDGATRLWVTVLGRDEGLQGFYAEQGYGVAATSMFKPLE